MNPGDFEYFLSFEVGENVDTNMIAEPTSNQRKYSKSPGLNEPARSIPKQASVCSVAATPQPFVQSQSLSGRMEGEEKALDIPFYALQKSLNSEECILQERNGKPYHPELARGSVGYSSSGSPMDQEC